MSRVGAGYHAFDRFQQRHAWLGFPLFWFAFHLQTARTIPLRWHWQGAAVACSRGSTSART